MNKCLVVKSFFVLLIVLCVATNAQALLVDPFNTDIAKVSNKVSATVQEGKSRFERMVETIRGSQFVTTIGNGLKQAKKGIKWFEDKAGQVRSFAQKAKSSPEYKATQKSIEIAAAEKEKLSLKSEMERKISEIKDNESLEVALLNEKIAIAQRNRLATIEMQEAMLAEQQSQTNNATKSANDENMSSDGYDELIAEMENEAISYQEEITAVHEVAAAEIDSVKSKYEDEIAAQAELIVELGIELASIMEGIAGNVIDKKASEEAKGSLTDQADKENETFFFKKGQKRTVDDIEKKRKKAKKEVKKNALSSINDASTNLNSGSDNRSKAENMEIVQDGQSGKSEVVQVAIEQTITQIDLIRNFLIMELKDLKSQVDKELDARSFEESEDKSVINIDICNYEVKQVDDYEEETSSSNSANNSSGME